MDPFINASRELAATLGEQSGRTTSRVMGQGLRNVSGGALSHDAATDLVHLAMVAGVASPKHRPLIGLALFFTFLAGSNRNG